jgi:hypothetical protein
MKTDICKHCGVVFATKGQFGEPQYRYGAQHKPDCPYGKKTTHSDLNTMIRLVDTLPRKRATSHTGGVWSNDGTQQTQ